MAKTRTVFAPGTGLRYVSETVAAHGGQSFVEANTLGGSTFTLSFRKIAVA